MKYLSTLHVPGKLCKGRDALFWPGTVLGEHLIKKDFKGGSQKKNYFFSSLLLLRVRRPPPPLCLWFSSLQRVPLRYNIHDFLVPPEFYAHNYEQSRRIEDLDTTWKKGDSFFRIYYISVPLISKAESSASFVGRFCHLRQKRISSLIFYKNHFHFPTSSR